ncbi:XRE family transcriptional regulator [Spirulina sp. 06S082]|uniref:XRE family transcriptional regulator n=1 Tax=Spirulina sp. 06S082 TaxID=3110248 RepID=UPI002B20ECEC|nr:XRE family transcriptional regulator [Spirulina sp. 06S082]MEA5467322.1 XRE family transcriptional regulator [Spirulina sp. 06S082]
MTKYTTLSDELNKLPKERQEAIEARASQILLEEITLKHLREKLGLSQSELAECLEVQQPAISKLERRQNLELNTLREVVNALGGTIEVIVRIPNKEPILLSDKRYF